MTTPNRDAVVLNIMGKEYKIACDAEERQGLIDSAKELDQQMRQIRDSGKVNGAERIAVMAALNLVHDLSASKTQNKHLPVEFSLMLASLSTKIENVLESR